MCRISLHLLNYGIFHLNKCWRIIKPYSAIIKQPTHFYTSNRNKSPFLRCKNEHFCFFSSAPCCGVSCKELDALKLRPDNLHPYVPGFISWPYIENRKHKWMIWCSNIKNINFPQFNNILKPFELSSSWLKTKHVLAFNLY